MHLQECSHKVRDMSLCPRSTNECCVHRQLPEPTTDYYFSTAPKTSCTIFLRIKFQGSKLSVFKIHWII